MNTNQPTEAVEALPTPVFYEPQHDEETQRRIAAAFARRGYELTADEDAVLSILADGDGSILTILWGDLGSSLCHVGEYASPEEYVTAAADWFESDLENDGPAEPGAAEKAARAEWIAGMRAMLDMLDAAPQLPLPHFSRDKIAFYTSHPLQSARIARELEGYQLNDRPGHIWRYEATGRLRGVDVAVYVGGSTGVSL